MDPTRDQERALAQSLAGIDGTADMICRGVELFDPDRIAQELDAQTEQLGDVLAELMAEPEEEAPAADLHAEVQRAVVRLLDLGVGHEGPGGDAWIAARTLEALAQALGGSVESSHDARGTTLRLRLPG